MTKIFLFLLLIPLPGCISSQAEDMKPNIIFLITDDQFKSMMNFYPEGRGQNLTPNTDQLAAHATVMNRQYVTSPVCTPSRYSCLTGLYPSRSQSKAFLHTTTRFNGQSVVQWNTFITEENNLPRRLRDAGYFTGMVGKNHAFEAEGWKKPEWEANPLHSETKQLLQANRLAQAAMAKTVGFDFTASLYYNNPTGNGIKALASHNLDWIAKGAIDFIDTAATRDKPFFLYLATTIPHGPQEPNKSWNADRRITADALLDKPLEVLPHKSTLNKRLKAAGIKGNKQNVLWLDDMVGAVVDKLKSSGKFDNTILVYFNDHGQAAKGTIYEGGVHAESFFWRKEGFPAGSISEIPVSNIDFAPTLLDLAGVSYQADDFDGKSFAPLLLGKNKKRDDPLYFELGFVRGVMKDGWKYIALNYPESAINISLDERAKVLKEFNIHQKRKSRPVHNTDPKAPFSHISLIPGGGDAEHMSLGQYPAYYDSEQLYNLNDDPGEQNNLSKDPANAAKLDEMKNLLINQLKQMPGTFGKLKN